MRDLFLRELVSAVPGIPMLVVVDAEGNTVTTNGRGAVAEQGAAAIQRW